MKHVLIVYSLILLCIIIGVQAELEQYPDLFVRNNILDTTIVYGDQASGKETGAAFTIAESIDDYYTQYNQQILSGTATPSSSSESVHFPIEDLELEEAISDEQDTLTEDDFPELLPSGTISTSEGDTDYDQYLRFETSDSQVHGLRFVYDVYDEKQDVYLLGEKDDFLFEWEIDFDNNLESDIDDDQLEDITNEELNILGTDMIIANAKLNGNEAELSFLRKDKELHLVEGQPQQVMINGETYTIEAQQILDGSSEVIFKIDGEASDTLKKGERDKIGDIYVVVLEVLLNEAQEGSADTGSSRSFDTSVFQGMTESQIRAYLTQTPLLGGEDVVKIALGTQFIEMRDPYGDTNFANTVKINGKSIGDAFVKIQGTKNGNTFGLDKIVYRAQIDPKDGNEVYIEEDEGGVRETLDEPDVMLGDSWDITNDGIVSTDTEEVQFKPTNDKSYSLTFTNIGGDACEVPLIDNSQDGGLGFNLGDEDHNLFFIECTGGTACIAQGDYFIVSDDNDYTGRTTVLEYRSHAESSKTVTFKNKCTGQSIDEAYTGTIGSNATGEITLNGKDFLFHVGADGKIAVDQNKDGNISQTGKAFIITKGGLRIDLGTTNDPRPAVDQGFSVFLSIEEELFDEQGPFDFGGNENVEIFLMNKSNNKVDLVVENQNHLKLQSGDEPYIKKGMSPYGVLYTYEDPSGDAAELTLEVPKKQLLGKLDIVKYPGPITQSSSINSTPISLTDFLQHKTATDSSIFSATSQNLVVVGSPCTNTIASLLLNNPSVCSAGFKEGTGIIRLFSSGAKYQVLVAGKTDQDIEKAAAVLAHFDMYNLQGTLFEVTGTTANPEVHLITLSDWETQFHTDLGSTPNDTDIPNETGNTIVTSCNDNLDNDGDGRIDYPLDPGCSNPQDSDETDVIRPPPLLNNNNLNDTPTTTNTEENNDNGFLWILIGIILIGGAGGAAWWIMHKHAKAQEEDMPPPEGYTKEQWKESLAYYKEHYPEWYTKYMEWWKHQKKNTKTKEMALIALFIGVSIAGLAMIITVSLPGETSVGLAGDLAGQATSVITCTHGITGDQFILPGSASEETLHAYLCIHLSGSWQCNFRGQIIQGMYCNQKIN